MRKLQLGELTATVAGGRDGSGGGEGPIVVLLHGFGAPGTDLVPLARELPARSAPRFIFPQAPLMLQPGPPDFAGRAWWRIEREALEVAIRTQRHEELVRHTPAGLAQARCAVESLLEGISEAFGPSSPVFLGGFSQGAMVATDTVLQSRRRFAGLIILSGALICEEDWRKQSSGRAGLPVFQSHGRVDPILPYLAAELLREVFETGGLVVDFHEFLGGHGIPAEVLSALGEFIDRHAGVP